MRIAIDGNIGAGKTTQLDLLESKGWLVQREPIDMWPLKEFYEDPKTWAFPLHLRILQLNRKSRAQFYERATASAYWVFWQVLKKQGVPSKLEDELYSWYFERLQWVPDVYIYISKDPEVAWAHIQKRNQDGDPKVTLEYIKELDNQYKILLKNIPCLVHVVNGNQGVEKVHEDICKIISGYDVHIDDPGRQEVQVASSRRREVFCTPFENLCRLS